MDGNPIAHIQDHCRFTGRRRNSIVGFAAFQLDIKDRVPVDYRTADIADAAGHFILRQRLRFSDDVVLYAIFIDEYSLPETGAYGIVILAAIALIAVGAYFVLRRKGKVN